MATGCRECVAPNRSQGKRICPFMLHNNLRLTQLTIAVKSAIFAPSTGRNEKVGLGHVRTLDRPQSR
jgi:hypothetical protein